eukprot:m.445605 g.445605  ORF g.445605 m.445605 type:complete len:313 (+) comp19254_c0_seq1:56-994(+)
MLVLLSSVVATVGAEPACPPFGTWAKAHRLPAYEATPERAGVYAANCARFDLMNEAGNGMVRFEADHTAHLTPSEFSARFGGCYHEPTVATAAQPPAAASRSATPISIDWRTKGQVTPVKNQGAFGTCWSFGVAENLEGLNVRQGNPLTNISEQEFISCCSTCQGRSAENSFEWLVNATKGVPALEKTYPYVGKPETCELSSAPRAPVVLHSWGRVSDDGTGRPVAEGLAQHGPMGMGVDATCFQGYKTGIIRNCTSKGIDHAVLMVAAGVDTGVSYFTIKNSWGQKWGEEGYVRIEQGHQWWGNISTVYTM